jgi:hypothetical protein
MKKFKQFVLNNRRGWGLGIAIYQLIGSLIIFLLMFLNIHELSAGVILVLIPLIGITLTGFIASIVYFVKGYTLRFFTLSKLNFCFQMLQLSVSGFAFAFYYGPYLAIGFDGDAFFRIKFEMLTANFALRLGETEEQYALINLIPLIPILALRWVERNPVEVTEYENSFLEEQREEAS